MSDPQPIHKAPTDGTHVLGYCPLEEPNWVAIYYDDQVGCWLHVEELVRDVVGEALPTHFVPMPPDP